MLISEDEKKVVIGKVKFFLDGKACEYKGFIIADDGIIDRLYDMYIQFKKLGRKKIAFNDFCIHYIAGDYNYTIKQGWEKYE